MSLWVCNCMGKKFYYIKYFVVCFLFKDLTWTECCWTACHTEVIFFRKLIIIIPDLDLEGVNNYLHVTSPITQFLEQTTKIFCWKFLGIEGASGVGEPAEGTDWVGRINLKRSSGAPVSGRRGIIYNISEVKIWICLKYNRNLIESAVIWKRVYILI